jgi:hypothetical protein
MKCVRWVPGAERDPAGGRFGNPTTEPGGFVVVSTGSRLYNGSMNSEAFAERARQRRRRIVTNKAASFAEADAWDLDYWQSLTPEQRLEAFLVLRDDVRKAQEASASRTAPS